MNFHKREPIIYTGQTDIRFGDLDPYGHLNAKHYLDLVASTRLAYLERHLDCPLAKTTKQGIGFFLRSAEQNFQRPITGICRINVDSWVTKVAGASLSVQYRILSEDREKAFADGVLQYVVVNLQNERPTKVPHWLADLFLQPAENTA